MRKSPLFGFLPLTLSGSLVLLMAACAPVGPDYQEPRPTLPVEWQNAQGYISHAELESLRQWWRLFNDPHLDALISEAITANPDLDIAMTRIREARALGRIADAALLPTADLGGAYTNSGKSEHIPSGGTRQDLFVLNFDAGWELDLFGGYRRQSEAAAATLQASREDYRDVLVSLTAEVARQYLDLRAAQKRFQLTRQNIELQQQTLDLTRERFVTGLGNALEVTQAQTQLALLRAQLPPLTALAAKARHQLAYLLGKPPQAVTWLGTGPLPQPPQRLPALLPSEILRQRPDIRGAERQLAAANAEVGVATADLFPRFSLLALVGLQSTDFQQLITSGSRYWSVGPAIQWPFFDGGRRRATLEASEARLDRARLNYEKTVLGALKEVEDALVDFDREQETRARLEEAVHSSRQAAELSQHQYKAGLSNFLNVLLAETTLAQSEDRLAQSDQSLSLAMTSLFKAMGGGWQTKGAHSPSDNSINTKSSEAVPVHP